MASSSSSSRRKEKVAQVTRNANPSGWISDDEIRGKFLFWRVIKYVVPRKYLDLQLFKKEGFLFQEWIAYQGLSDFVQMKGDCYPDLVEVFYTNLRVVNGVIHSRVKVKLIAYVLTWLLLLGRFVEDRMSTEDVFLLNAINTRIPTNWVTVLKDRIIAAGHKYAHKLQYGVFIIQVLILQGVDVSQEVRLVCNKSQKIGMLSLFSIGLERTVNEWFFRDELTNGSTPTPAADHTAFIPQTDFEKYVVDQFRKKSERDERVEVALFRWEKKGNKNGIGFETEDSDDESTDED
ncbi:hypothetical protein LR48_Vigan04g079500 [Vigna angularis]|uniref:Uncharacterized protein n=1 Tax=Phaseolus angularis TaxID=3914 RepID=A0A0L9UDH1_PHAAN|nr:hypothetical protein LR48_Vigan04g079500 [Vigna angularis]